jgi:hypothetical protein
LLLLPASSSRLPAKRPPNLHRLLVLGSPGHLPEFVDNRLPKHFLVLALQGFSEFPQQNLFAPLHRNIDWSFSPALFLIPDFSNFVIICRHRSPPPLTRLGSPWACVYMERHDRIPDAPFQLSSPHLRRLHPGCFYRLFFPCQSPLAPVLRIRAVASAARVRRFFFPSLSALATRYSPASPFIPNLKLVPANFL